MTFSELVWSPHNGLSLRCAVGSVSEKNPSLVWGAGPSTILFSPTPSSTTGTNCDKLMKEGDFIAPPPPVTFLVKDDVSDNAISPSALECSARISPASNPEPGHDSGFCGKVEITDTMVNAQTLNPDMEDLGLGGYSCERKMQTATVIGTRETNLSFSPGIEKGRVVDDLSKSTECKHNVVPVILMPGNGGDVDLCGSIGHGKNSDGHQISIRAELEASQQFQAPDSLMLNQSLLGTRKQETGTIMKEESRKKTPLCVSNSALPLEKVDSTAENDFRPLCKVVSDSAVDFQRGFQNKEKLHLDVCVASKAFPLRAYMCKRRGKEKALSDGDMDGRMSEDVDDDSHESVESCSSGAFNAGKKRILSFEQQLIVGSKRVKQKIQEHPGSTSLTKIDSSFMNWISNMAKGYPKPAQAKAPSFALSLENPENGNGLTTCSRNQDAECGNMGFQSFFKSFYSPKQKVPDQKMLLADQWTGEGHEQIEFTKKPQDFNRAQVTSEADDLEPGKSNLFLAARPSQSMLGDVEGKTTYVQTSDENVAAFELEYSENRHPYKRASDVAKDRGSSHCSSLVKQKTNSGNNVLVDLGADNWEPGKSNILPPSGINQFVLVDGEDQLAHGKMSDENVATCQLDDQTHSANGYSGKQSSHMAKEGQSSNNCSLGKQTLTGNNASHLQSEAKLGYSLVNRDDLPSSMQVTRFCPKISGSKVKFSFGKQSMDGVIECPKDCNDDCPKFGESSEPRGYPSEGLISAVGKDIQNYATDNEASSGLKRIEGQKIDLIVRSTRLKSSESLTSVVAKRLDALKQILLPQLSDRAAEVRITCFFCGARGHDLKECPRMTETELEGLLCSVSAYGGAEESPCLCIRCFQFDHWAVACPNASSKKQQGFGSIAALPNHSIWSDMHSHRASVKLLENVDSQIQVVREHAAASNTTNYKRCRLSTNLDVELNMAASSSSRLISLKNPNLVDEVPVADYRESAPEVPRFTYPCNATRKQMSDVSKGIFEAVKKLRLSRADVLKWMDSSLSFSHLDGYYLRLRLGNWEEGLGGTGYYVACITGAQGERSPETSKKHICVDVGGTRCLIGSQYISNQDFLEDELVAWWSATAKAGGKIPTEEHLRAKVDERIRLGL